MLIAFAWPVLDCLLGFIDPVLCECTPAHPADTAPSNTQNLCDHISSWWRSTQIAYDFEVYAIGDSSNLLDWVLFVVTVCMDVCFVVDIITMFLTPVMSEFGTYNYDKKYIAKKYLRGWFWMDLISTIPFDVIALTLTNDPSRGAAESTLLSAARLGRGLRLFRLMRIFRLVKLNNT